MNNKRKWLLGTIGLLIVTNIVTFAVSSRISLSLPNGKVIIGRQQYNDILQFQKLFYVKDILYNYYDGKIDDNVLVEGAIKGMTDSLNDPYTVFMNAKEYEDFSTQTEGSYVGLGIQVGVKDDRIVVIAPFDNSPAKKAGILTGDIIEKVNGIDVSGKELERAVSMMRGEENTSVNVTIFREGKGDIDYDIKRQKIDLVTVKGEMLKDNIGYIQISMFDEHTSKAFSDKIKELDKKGMKSLIIDLRGNPGGLLDECIDVVSNFLPKGKQIVSTIDKYNNEKKYESKGGDFIGLPLAVLTDGGTASASEIVSGAVRDYNIGTLIGTKTFGKGVVQTILDTEDGTALKVTISKYYTPNGENIHGIGIKPDIEIEYPEELREKPYTRSGDTQLNKAIEVIKAEME